MRYSENELYESKTANKVNSHLKLELYSTRFNPMSQFLSFNLPVRKPPKRFQTGLDTTENLSKNISNITFRKDCKIELKLLSAACLVGVVLRNKIPLYNVSCISVLLYLDKDFVSGYAKVKTTD